MRAADASMPPVAQNPCRVYLRTEAVDALAARLSDAERRHAPKVQPWGMYEFALSDPDGALVQIGWPQMLREDGAAPAVETPSAALGN